MQFLVKKYDVYACLTCSDMKKSWACSNTHKISMLQKRCENAYLKAWTCSIINKINKLQTKTLRCAISCVYYIQVLVLVYIHMAPAGGWEL